MHTELRDKSAGEHELVPFLASPEAAFLCCLGQLQIAPSQQVHGEEEAEERFGEAECAVVSLQQASCCGYRKVCAQSTDAVGGLSVCPKDAVKEQSQAQVRRRGARQVLRASPAGAPGGTGQAALSSGSQTQVRNSHHSFGLV